MDTLTIIFMIVLIADVIYNFWLIRKRKKHDAEMIANLREFEQINRNHQALQKANIERLTELSKEIGDEHRREVAELKEKHDAFIKEHFTTAVDISMLGKDPSYVIVIGKLRNADFLRCYHLGDMKLDGIVAEMSKLEEQYGNVDYVDTPPMFKGLFKRD